LTRLSRPIHCQGGVSLWDAARPSACYAANILKLPTILPVLLALAGGLAAADPAPGQPLASPLALTARGAGDAPAIELAEAVAKSRVHAGSHHIDRSKQ